MTYCEKCMRPMEGRSVCPVCGELPRVPSHHLAPGTVLQEKYLAGRAIAEDGGSITYLGRDLSADEVVVIREFFPAEDAIRDHAVSNAPEGMEKYEKAANRFLEKARLLLEFRNEPCVAGVLDYFRCNHTAYMVMERPDGLSMQTFVWKKGPVPVEGLLEMMKPLLNTLQQIHRKNLIHRNINPENIRLYADGSMKLVNFGAVSGAVDENSLKPGYAPAELYGIHGRSGPWSDVYALCATIYTCITGVVPQLSVERAALDQLRRPSELGAVLTSRQEAAIMRGLSVWPEARVQSVAQLMDELDLVEPVQEEEIPAFEAGEEDIPVLTPQEEVPAEEPAKQLPEEEPVEEAPRFEPVEDPADWMDLPDVPAPVDPVFRQGKAEAAPETEVQEHIQTTLWSEEPEQEDVVDTRMEAAEEPMAELPQEKEPAQTSLWEQLLAQPDEGPQPWESVPGEEPERAEPQQEEPAREASSEEENWQGDYTPVEPIDPKFWQKELGLAEPDEPMPWEESPGAWEETPKPWDVPEQWQEEPAAAEEEKKRKLWPVFAAAGLLIAVAVTAIVWMLLPGSKTKAMTLKLDGIAYTLPCTLAELNEDGWLTEGEEDDMVDVNHVIYSSLEKNGRIRILASNLNDTQTPMGACVVTKIIVTDPSVDVDVSGIDLTASLEDVVTVLGKPTEQTEETVSYTDGADCTWIFKKAEDGEGLKSITVQLPE